MKPDMGTYYEMLDGLASQPTSSFLADKWIDIESWRQRVRSKVFELLAFNPSQVPLRPLVEAREKWEDLVVEEISYDMPYGPRTHGFFIYPDNQKTKLPAVVALHDHGSFFYFGKEKIAGTHAEPAILSEFKQQYYGGRSWATELARRGFAVLAVDIFLWGSRKIPMDSVNEDFQKHFDGAVEGSDEYIRRYNDFWAINECMLTVGTILNAGTSWPSIFSYEDRRSVDYLMTRSEIDPNRIACGGLSGGGLRTIFLAGLDARIRCGFCVGFMTTIRGVLRNHIKCPPGHGLLMYVPHLFELLDLPDIISLHAPSPLMVQYNKEDELFTLEGQREADQKIGMIYSKMGRPESYTGRFYEGRHKFDAVMQEEVFQWLEECLDVQRKKNEL